jgi:hypothetical protein
MERLGLDFFPGLQEGLMGDRGTRMVHEMALACPKCRTSDPAANMLQGGKFQRRLPDCPNCGGDGWLYRDPIIVIGLATSMRQQANPVDVGIVQVGDMQFSLLPGAFGSSTPRRVSANDRLTQLWDTPLDDGQTIVRGAAHLSTNARFAKFINPNEDRVWYEPQHGLWCEDENKVKYHDGSDFTLGPGKLINWIGNKPAIGTKYVLKYTAFLEWIVWAPPQERTDRGEKDLGQLLMLRKRHIANINESPFVTEDDRQPLSGRVPC